MVFIKNEKPYGFYMISGRSKCCYVGFRYVSGDTRFFAGAFSMNSFEDFNGKIMCIGGAHSGNPCAKVIILVLFVFSIVWNLKSNEHLIKFRCPFNVTHKNISVIFIKI